MYLNMRSPKNNENPWRLFRRARAERCRLSQSQHESRGKQTIEQTGSHESAEDRFSDNLNDCQGTERFCRQYDDNANANKFDKYRFYRLKYVSMCDKQTQTGMVEETVPKPETRVPSASRKVIYSRSSESLVRNPTLKPHTSRSFNVCKMINKPCKSLLEYEKKLFKPDNLKEPSKNKTSEEKVISPIRHEEKSVFPEGQSMTDGFYVHRNFDPLPDEHEEMSQNVFGGNGFSESQNRVEKINNKRLSSNKLYSDLESNLKNMSCQERADVNYKNQWSPFHKGHESDPIFYDCRQIDEISLASERSRCSTTSEEADIGYEIIDWNQYTENYSKEENCDKRKSDAFNTPLTTPTIDLSGLDGYHTAPNSPEGPGQYEQSHFEEKRSPHDRQSTSDYSNNYTSEQKHGAEVMNFANVKEISQNNNTVKNPNSTQNLCCRCGKATKNANKDDKNEMPENKEQTNERKVAHEQLRQNENASAADSRILRLETPPFISVNSLHYEADPETGKAKVVGRGSFGRVYKARFADPMFSHLPIVIKEFDEEFTSSKEVVEEAKRLHYLLDTGYVPICYGLLCFGSPIQPKYGIVQEYVGTGLTLEQMLWDQYELPLEFWFRIVIQCCEGLARFHGKGILLNDIKTNNILLEFGEHSVRIRYIDFGLATDMRGKRYKNTRSLDDFVYLAPEVRRDGKITNIASDIYSLGYILEQIKQYTGVHELTVVARLCMDRDPDMRIPPRAAASMIKDHMVKVGFDPMVTLGM